MVRVLLTKYWVLAHLLMIAGTLCFAPAVSAGAGLWASASLLLMTVCLPPVLKGESFWLARSRVWQALRSDPVFWCLLLALLYVGCTLFNGPRDLVYSYELRRWNFTEPFFKFFPAAIRLESGVPFFCGIAGGLSAAVAVRSALPRRHRLYALIGLGVIGGLLALIPGVFSLCTGRLPELLWLGGRYGASVLWILLFSVMLGVAGEAFLEGRIREMGVALAAAAANQFGIFAFASSLPLCVAIFITILYLFFALFAVRAAGRYPRILWRSVLILPMCFGAGLGLALAPESCGLACLDTELWADRLTAFASQWGFRCDLAFRALEMNPMLGIGPEGFEEVARLFLKGSKWTLWRSGGTELPCDFLTLLVERGLIGSLLLLLPGAAMLGKCLMRWVEYRQSVRKRYSLRYIFVLIGSLVGVVTTLLLSFAGTPLHAPATLVVFLVICSAMGGWMPRPR